MAPPDHLEEEERQLASACVSKSFAASRLTEYFSFVFISFSSSIMVKMPVIVLSLSLLCFTVNANSQSCVEETLDCNKAVPTVFKLSDASCPCDDASHSGVLKFSDNEVHVCAGTVWNMVHLIKEVSGPYGSEGNPGQSCDDIYDELVKGSAPEDGIYWLRFPLPGNGLYSLF